MPRLKPETQAARRTSILDAAEKCFAASGFHATSMQDICKTAGVSPGAVYGYFKSKEELIEGICERNRREFAERFAALDTAPDFLAALATLAEQYLIEEPREKRVLCVEIGAEACRNATVAELMRSIDELVDQSFRRLFERLKAQGRIPAETDIDALMRIFTLLGDGLFWRQAVDSQFDAKQHLDAVISVIGSMIGPQAAVVDQSRHAPVGQD
ncbi:MAG: TetR/AcrR family transcriptional regulator [Hyphomicrobiaceae bacterium]|nr:TetR/AcrR family transcriptional regulator [Hyphomicrobiaceae bacterium]